MIAVAPGEARKLLPRLLDPVGLEKVIARREETGPLCLAAAAVPTIEQNEKAERQSDQNGDRG